MSEGLSRPKRLVIAATTAAYAAACVAAAMWLCDLSRELGPKGLDLVLIPVVAFAAPVAFPFWRSMLGPTGRQIVFLGALLGAMSAGFVTVLASFATLDPNLSSPLKSPAHTWAVVLAGLAGTFAGVFIASGQINRPPAPAGSDRAVAEEKAWAELQRKGRQRVLIEGFCIGCLWMPVMSLLDIVFRGRWAAVREQWTGPDLPANIVVILLFGCWWAYSTGVVRWNDMARRHGAPDGMPPLANERA